MKTMRNALLSAVGMAVLISGAAMAQPRPQQIDAVMPVRIATYQAVVTALTPAAAATDFLTVTGSATNVVRIKSVECSGISTANATAVIVALRRTTANTGGTSTATPIVASDSNDSAATAVVAAYTANPTLGTTVANSFIRAGRLTTGTAASSTIETTPPVAWYFGNQNDKEPVLRGATQVFALNGIGATFSAGTALTCMVSWSESPN